MYRRINVGKEWLFYVFLLFMLTDAFAMSKLVMPDGIARITLKNDLPCFYLNNNKDIKYLGLEKLEAQAKISNADLPIQAGNNIKNCIAYGNNFKADFFYNIPYKVFLGENEYLSSGEVHITSFCVEKKYDLPRLVQVTEDNLNQYNCSTLDWKPQKYYGGLFGWLEKLKDSIFNKDIIEYK
ncbi:hypothetical protein BV914_07900 [Neisseria dumasiana]|nr:hypothetical protein BV914_07900 [Neisseria dumasiana]